MKKLLISAAIAVSLTSCNNNDSSVVDQCLRTKIFILCLDNVPRASKRTVFNDIAEAIEQCRFEAKNQSKRPKSNVKIECREK